jgi:hypothetical protein
MQEQQQQPFVQLTLSRFPPVYRSSLGATQLTSIHRLFEHDEARVSLADVHAALGFDAPRAELLLDLLESRNVIVQQQQQQQASEDGVVFWRRA